MEKNSWLKGERQKVEVNNEFLVEGSHQQSTVRSQYETLDTSNMHQGLEKGTRKKEISFVRTGNYLG